MLAAAIGKHGTPGFQCVRKRRVILWFHHLCYICLDRRCGQEAIKRICRGDGSVPHLRALALHQPKSHFVHQHSVFGDCRKGFDGNGLRGYAIGCGTHRSTGGVEETPDGGVAYGIFCKTFEQRGSLFFLSVKIEGKCHERFGVKVATSSLFRTAFKHKLRVFIEFFAAYGIEINHRKP